MQNPVALICSTKIESISLPLFFLFITRIIHYISLLSKIIYSVSRTYFPCPRLLIRRTCPLHRQRYSVRLFLCQFKSFSEISFSVIFQSIFLFSIEIYPRYFGIVESQRHFFTPYAYFLCFRRKRKGQTCFTSI